MGRSSVSHGQCAAQSGSPGASCGLSGLCKYIHPCHPCSLQLAPPLLMASLTNPLTTTRGSWYQQDVTGAGWPILNASTYYWVAVTPSVPLTMTAQGGGVYNGARWVGLNDAVNPVPAVAATDPHIFKGRQIVSQRFRGDSLYIATSPTAAAWIASQPSWQTLGTRFTDWDLGNSSVRYGVQLLGWQIWPTPSVTPSGTQRTGLAACVHLTLLCPLTCDCSLSVSPASVANPVKHGDVIRFDVGYACALIERWVGGTG